MTDMEHETEVVYDEDNKPGSGQPFAQAAPLVRGEASVGVLAQQARAQVEARFLIALHRPRDLDTVRVKLLKDCARPGFAETARYRRPAGRKKNERTGEWEENFIEGPSIRFAEAAIRLMGNVDVENPIVFEDDDKLIVRVVVTDLETNATHGKDLSVNKLVEKRTLRKGQRPLGTRTNSYGETVYLVPATDGEIEQKAGAAISKAVRTLGLRLVPGDIVEECMDLCIQVRDAKIKKDPEGERKRMIDAFAGVGVMPDALKAYMGQELSALAPNQIGELRDLFLAIRDGITTWADAQRARAQTDEDESEGGDDGGKSALDELRAKAAKHAAEVKARAADRPPEPAKVERK